MTSQGYGDAPRKSTVSFVPLSTDVNSYTAQDYHRMENHFIDLVLKTYKRTLPLSLVALFVEVADYLGLDAHGVSFPGHVHAIVRHQDEWVHIDVFNHARGPAILDPAHLRGMLNEFELPDDAHDTFMGPATTRDLVIRQAQNIQSSHRMEQRNADGPTPRSRFTLHCSFASSVAFLFMDGGRIGGRRIAPLAQTVVRVTMMNHPLDHAILVKELQPLLALHSHSVEVYEVRQYIAQIESDDMEPKPVKRAVEALLDSVDDVPVLYHVGCLMRHARLGYVGVVVGWDVSPS